MPYSVTISIDSTGVSNIYAANQYVTFLRNVTAWVQSGPAAVHQLQLVTMPVTTAWLAFQPYQSNTITWTDSSNVYATSSPLQAFQQIGILSQTAAQAGLTYPFQQAQFGSPSSNGTGAYAISNQQSNGLAFGLSATASVNNVNVTAPFNAVPVLNNQIGVFMPTDTVTILLTSCSTSGTIIPQLGGGLVVSLSGSSPSVSVGFNDTTNSFYVSSS